MRDKFFNFVVRHPVWVILAFLVFAFAAASGAQKLVFKSDYRIFFDDENPQLVAYESMQKIYNKSDNVTFIIVPKGDTVFTPEHLKGLTMLTKASWQIPYSTRVNSLTNFQHTYAEEDDMIVSNLVNNPESLTPLQLENIREIALAEPQLVNKIVSNSGHVSVVDVSIKLPGLDPTAEIPEVASHVRQLRDGFLATNPGAQVYLSGMVMLNNAFAEASMEDSATLIPLMFLTVIVIIGVLLRTISGTIATVLIIFMSIVTAMGLAGWMGFFLSGASASAPTIILTLAVADCIHILASMFYEMRNGADKRSAILTSLKVNLQPIFLTSITTAIGFLSMNFSEIPPYRDLGNIVAMGGMLAFVFSVTIFPALLLVLPIRVKVNAQAKQDKMSKFADFVIAKRRLLLPLVSVVVVVLTVFIPKNVINDDFVKYFDTSVPFREATDFMQDNLSGMTVMELSVKSGEANGVNNPAYLKQVSDFSDWLRTQPETDHVNTLTDVLKRLNMNMHGDDESWYRLPESPEMSAQYLLLYEMSLPYGLDLNTQLNVDKSSTKLIVTFKNLTSGELVELGERVENWFAVNANQYELDVASPSFMFAHIGQKSIVSMLVGTLVALVLISVLLGFALKSWRYGLISLIPNLLPAAVAFGIWGIINGQIGMSMSMVIGMTLGIVVDDTVHFLSKYLHARRNHKANAIDAVHYAFGNVGSALWITTLVLVAGFTVLAQSSFKLNGDMGLLTAITILVALLIDFLLLPPLLILMDEKRKNSQQANTQSDRQQTDLADLSNA
ncbi:RND transporter [Marinomonas sp. S3726]|uniref:efflux RND transporter permease subunit n=1 Tax=Marinomonas sp. S3726 TaxID=579484 RepID=UPI0005F9AF3A|nr:MMPL family transporter [Marinomonas sp. S3726]KJZ11998.1 RND transporter [Marinomonas sp. S3726]